MALCRDGLKGEILDPNDCELHPLIHTLLGFQQVLYFADFQDKSTGGG